MAGATRVCWIALEPFIEQHGSESCRLHSRQQPGIRCAAHVPALWIDSGDRRLRKRKLQLAPGYIAEAPGSRNLGFGELYVAEVSGYGSAFEWRNRCIRGGRRQQCAAALVCTGESAARLRPVGV